MPTRRRRHEACVCCAGPASTGLALTRACRNAPSHGSALVVMPNEPPSTNRSADELWENYVTELAAVQAAASGAKAASPAWHVRSVRENP